MDELELIRRALSGDEAAQSDFVARYDERLYRTAIHFLGYRDPEARDMVQQTFVIAWEKLESFEFNAQVYTWLNRICVNLCYDRLRFRQRQLLAQHEDLEAALGGSARAVEALKAEEALFHERAALLHQELRSLKKRCRELIDLRDLQGHSYAEVSRRLRLPLGTVMSSLARCREALKLRVLRALRVARG